MKSFIFSAYWPKSKRGGRPSYKRGIISAESKEIALQRIREHVLFVDIETVQLVPVDEQTFEILVTG